MLIGRGKSDTLVGYARCKMWTCEYCAEKNKSIWRAAIIDAVNRLQSELVGEFLTEDKEHTKQFVNTPPITWQFWTFTAHKKARKTATSIKNIQAGWTRVYNHLVYFCKKNGYKMVYIRVYEPHKKGAIHVHMLVGFIQIADFYKTREKLPNTRWLKDQAATRGMGYQAKIYTLPVDNAGYVAAYITKYMTKMEIELPKGTRRIQASQNFITTMHPEKSPDSEREWYAMDTLQLRDALEIWGKGHDIIDLSTSERITTDEFDDKGNYKQPEQSSPDKL